MKFIKNKNSDFYAVALLIVNIILHVGYILVAAMVIMNLSYLFKIPYLSTMTFASLLFYLIVVRAVIGAYHFNYQDILIFFDPGISFKKVLKANALKHIVKFINALYFWGTAYILYLLINW